MLINGRRTFDDVLYSRRRRCWCPLAACERDLSGSARSVPRRPSLFVRQNDELVYLTSPKRSELGWITKQTWQSCPIAATSVHVCVYPPNLSYLSVLRTLAAGLMKPSIGSAMQRVVRRRPTPQTDCRRILSSSSSSRHGGSGSFCSCVSCSLRKRRTANELHFGNVRCFHLTSAKHTASDRQIMSEGEARKNKERLNSAKWTLEFIGCWWHLTLNYDLDNHFSILKGCISETIDQNWMQLGTNMYYGKR